MGRVQAHVRPDAEERRPAGRHDREVGAGLLATSTGVLVFLLLLLFAVQVLVGLYARSAVTAAAFDGARLAAGYEADGDRAEGRERAEAHVRQVLGAYADRPGFQLEWGDDPSGTSVVLTVRAENPSFVPPAVRRPMGLDHVERTVRVRVEDAA